MLLPTLDNTNGWFSQRGWLKSRGHSAPAPSVSGPTSFPSLPDLPGHTFYMVTPGGRDVRDAVADLFSLSSWFVAAYSTSEAGVSHLHYLVALPQRHDDWISKHPTIRSRFRRLPCVQYLTGYLVFSKITDVDGLREYLTGPRNSAKFFEFLNVKKISVTFSARAIWDPIPLIVPKSRKRYVSDVVRLSRGSVTASKLLSLRLAGAERLWRTNGRERSSETHEARQPQRLPGFQIKQGGAPDSDGFRSGYI